MIVAIDGPAGAGKSVLARKLAAALNFGFLDTGAMYRVATLACLRAEVDLSDQAQIAQCVKSAVIDYSEDAIRLNHLDVTHDIRTPEVSRAIRPIADHPEIRAFMVDWQRRIVNARNYVTEGRDQATIAFPNAECKIYLTASPLERATRRYMQLASAGVHLPIETILAEQEQRDFDDIHRPYGSLKVAEDAVYVHTDGMGEQEVLQRLIDIVNSCRQT